MRKEKQLLLDEVTQKIDKAPAIVITRYQGLTANMAHQFRGQVAKVGGEFEVVRKRLLVKAAQTRGIQLDVDKLPGHVGLIFANQDALAATKAVFAFGKENGDAFEVLAGWFDGQVVSASDVEAISNLPDRDTMRAQFLGLLEAPMAQTLAVIEALLTVVPHCLENKAQASGESA